MRPDVKRKTESAKLLKEISECSGGMFAPKSISETWSGEGYDQQITVSVTTQSGEELSETYDYESDYFDEDFYPFIDRVVNRNNPEIAVHWEETGGQDGLVIVGSAKAIKTAKKARLFSR